MLDTAANRSAILPSIVRELGIKSKKVVTKLTAFDSQTTCERQLVTVNLQSLDGTVHIELRDALVSDILTTDKDRPPTLEDVEDLDFMDGVVSFTELENERIGVVLSARHAWTWTGGEVLNGTAEQPRAVNTRFGWTIIGPCIEEEVEDAALNCCNVEEAPLSEEISRLFRYDFTMREGEKASPEENHPSRDDERAAQMIKETLRFDKDVGHYRCGLPWKNGRSVAASRFNAKASRRNALNRLMKEATKMRKDPVRREGVWNTMREMISDGHAKRVVDTDGPPGAPILYLPLHIVTQKPGKWRVCQDGAAKCYGVCLNDELLTGPDLLNRLVGVMMRFRLHEVALSADIKGFFHQIYVTENDSPAFRFLWFEDETMENVIDMEAVVHLFGAKSSSNVSTYVLRHHGGEISGTVSPEVVAAVLKAFYVDDFLGSYTSVEKARMIRIALTQALKDGGFDLTKWRSTHPEALEEAKAPTKEEDLVKTFDEPELNPSDKILGVAYSFKDDCFSIQVREAMNMEVKTRRQMLRVIASVFDPCGQVSPTSLKGKMLFQKATASGLQWDDELPDELKSEFDKWRSKLPQLRRVRMRRWLATPETKDGQAELHVFCDASEDGYGVACYRRCTGGGGEHHVALLFARAHVVPLEMRKQAMKDEENHRGSIPRLELTAARLAAQVCDMIRRESGETYKRTVLWSDSECVLKWIYDTKSRFKTFIRNRLSTIHELTGEEDWKYVPSADNPADDCSRGLKADDPKWQRFLEGPRFLWEDETGWPQADFRQKKGDAVPVAGINALTADAAEARRKRRSGLWILRLAESTEAWPAKIRRIAYFLHAGRAMFERWTQRRRGEELPQLPESMKPDMAEYREAENFLIREIQATHFAPEIETLRGMNVRKPNGREELRKRGSALSTIDPFVDESGLLRAGGRLAHSTLLTRDAKFPIIMPNHNVNVDSLIRWTHQTEGHAGVNHVLSYLRRRWSIQGGRCTIRRVIHHCIRCQKLFKEPQPQKMAPLPVDRLEVRVPFEATGVDVFGPFKVKMGGRATHKRWVMLFTCLGCRAVHFEMLKDLSTPTAINALVRFHSRRPGLRILYSDNGTNFRGADNEVKRAVETWNGSKMVEVVRAKGVEWKFGPPNTPHWGGIWERLVKTAKKHLSAILSSEDLDVDTFATVLVEVEGIMNRRPLTYASTDHRDLDVLTPADFLYPGVAVHTSVHVIPPSPPGDGESLRYAWKKARGLYDAFWTRWSKEYLTDLLGRGKWRRTYPDLKVGEVVIMTDDVQPRDCWRLGMVEAVHGDGTHVRTATVRVKEGKTFQRSCHKLVRLEWEQSDGTNLIDHL